MTLYELKQVYAHEAALLGDYELMPETYLANKYCDEEEALWETGDEEHEVMRGRYLSALMVKYWSKAIKWKTTEAASLNYDDNDYASMLYSALWVAFYYKQWRYEWKAKVEKGKFISWILDDNGEKIPNPYYYQRDPKAVDKIINRCCMSIRGKEYQKMNKQVRKANVLLYSIDTQQSDYGDSALEATGATTFDTIDGTADLIHQYLERDKWIEAFVVDSIIQENPFKLEKTHRKIIEDDAEKDIVVKLPAFDQRALAKYMREVDSDSLLKFCDKYEIIDSGNFISRIKGLKPTAINSYIKKTLTEIKHDEKLLSCIKQLIFYREQV